MADKVKKPEAEIVYRYYQDEKTSRVVRVPSNTAAMIHFYQPTIKLLSPDELMKFVEAGGKIEHPTAKLSVVKTEPPSDAVEAPKKTK